MNNPFPKIGVSIISQNGKQYLEKLLPTLFEQNYPTTYLVYLGDNGSQDGTIPWVKENFPLVKIISFPENKGFAVPNNMIFDKLFEDPQIQGVVCLNNDTIISKNFLRTLVSGLSLSSDVGSVQTKVVSFQDPEYIDSVGITILGDTSAVNRGQGEKDVRGQYEKQEEIFGTTASACLYTKEALMTTRLPGGDYFDSSYFAYNEDVDLAWRMRLAGFSSWYVPGEPVLHVHSATGGNYSAFKSFHVHRNTLFNIVKNLPGKYCYLGLFQFLARYKFLFQSIFKKRGASYQLSKKVGIFGTIGIVVRVWVSFLWNLPGLLKTRSFIQRTRRTSVEEIPRWLKVFQADTQKMFYAERARKL